MKILITTISVCLSMVGFMILVGVCFVFRTAYSYSITGLLLYVIFINLYGLFIMYVDKRMSKRKGYKDKRRVSERQLFIVTAMGGFVGTMMGMKLFRHKTQKTYFFMIFTLIAIIEIGAIVIIQKYTQLGTFHTFFSH